MISKIYRWFKDALFPSQCIICRKKGFVLCLKHSIFPSAPSSKAVFHSLDQCLALTAYANPQVKKIVQHYKYEGKQDLGKPLGALLVKLLSGIGKEDVFVVPLPLHWTRYIWRGFNQAEVLAQSLSQEAGIGICKKLKRKKYTQQQAKLSQQKRMQNIRGAFVWEGDSLEGKTIVLIDDVVASGVTLDEAAKVLKKAGALKVIGVVFARGGD